MKNILEVISCKLKDGIVDADFLKVLAYAEENFDKKQKGYIKHTLAKNEGGEWIDVLYWETMDDATKSMEAAMKSPIVAPVFEMIDDASVKISYFEIQS